MKVAVIGCGVAGMASALALARRGHQVLLYEAFEHPRPLGSGLLLQPSGLAALRALGLADAALAMGARVDRLDGRDEAGRRVMDMRYADWRPDAFGLGIHRAALFDVLFDALARAGVELKTGVTIEDVTERERPVLRDAAGAHHGPFDLAVCAEGSGSRLRARLRPSARAPVYPWGAVWANVVDNAGAFDGALNQRYVRAEVMAGVLPIGRAPGGNDRLVSVFWSLPRERLQEFLQADLEPWRARMVSLWPATAPLVAQVTEASMFSPAIYRDVRVGRWCDGATILIGDAAHGTSPQLGQGANLALIDAVELAENLTPRVSRSLVRYQAARRRQTGVYQFISRWLTPLFQSGGWAGAWVRTWMFTPTSALPPVRRLGSVILTGMIRLGRTPKSLRP